MLIRASTVASVGVMFDTDSLSITGADEACADAGTPHTKQLIAANAAKPIFRYAPIAIGCYFCLYLGALGHSQKLNARRRAHGVEELAVENGYRSEIGQRKVLEAQIETDLRGRQGGALTSFDRALPPPARSRHSSVAR